MRIDQVEAQVIAVVESIRVDWRQRSGDRLIVEDSGQRDAPAATDGMVTIEIVAGPGRSQSMYGWDTLDVEYRLTVHHSAAEGVKARLGKDLERLVVRLPTAVGGDLFDVFPGDPQITELDGGVAGVVPIRCTYRVDAAVVANTNT